MICWLDAASGVSGDKLLAGLLDLGERNGRFTLDDVRVAAESLEIGDVNVTSERVRRGGIQGLHVRVEPDPARPQPSRTWRDIREMLAFAELPGSTAERAAEAFGRLAAAEAHAHDVSADDVHFHEIGAVDSIVDIVGVSLGLELLGIDAWTVSPIGVGSGTVETEHGTLPVPAPATLELLGGAPVKGGGATSDGELTTPTGAALALANAAGFGGLPPMQVTAIGYGAGTREVAGLPNVLRIVVGEPVPERLEHLPLRGELVTLLETNLDHISPEAAAIAAEQLLSAGALDAWTAPIVMKKGRLGVVLSLLAPSDLSEKYAALTIALTGSLGVRRTDLSRFTAEREVHTLSTAYGPVRFKIGAGRARPEADDVARIAREQGRQYADVERELGDAWKESGR